METNFVFVAGDEHVSAGDKHVSGGDKHVSAGDEPCPKHVFV